VKTVRVGMPDSLVSICFSESGVELPAEQIFLVLFFPRSSFLGGGAGAEDSEELDHFRTGSKFQVYLQITKMLLFSHLLRNFIKSSEIQKKRVTKVLVSFKKVLKFNKIRISKFVHKFKTFAFYQFIHKLKNA
jgi:hypothetical protein